MAGAVGRNTTMVITVNAPTTVASTPTVQVRTVRNKV